ncbi:putative ribonuclease H-like domain-containing protein [Tanacetum coccineum]
MCDKKNKVLFTNTECLVLSSDFKLPDENQVLLRIPRQNNMYSFNLENIVPSGCLACLIAKAIVDESNKWHRRLGHVNFKNLNKLVKGNLVRGLPSKIFQNDHTCVACQKGKQHKASFHHVSTENGQDIFMLVEKYYPLTKGLTTLMLSNKLRVDQQSEMADEILTKIYNIANKPKKGGLLGFIASTLSTADRQTETGKESLNPLMADSLPKTIQSNDLPLSRGYTLGSGEDIHHVSTKKGQDIFMLVEKDYPLTKGLATLMLSNKLRVDQQSEMADELLTKIYNIANKPRK